jgi:2-iminobutanoate/2-iminopropanoate deaminase
VFPSGLTGVDITINETPSDPQRQAELLFQNIRAFMETAGGSIDDVVHVTLYLKEGQSREPFDTEWK